VRSCSPRPTSRWRAGSTAPGSSVPSSAHASCRSTSSRT
jgi:hypothetical protein